MESMNAQSSMTHNARTMQTKRIKWKNINWIIAESYVNRLQVRIVEAVQKGRWRLVKRLQKLITNSFYAKAIAVKRVITNKGKHTSGIDKVVWTTDEDKSKAIEKLDTLKYHAQPLRRVYIEKYGKKRKTSTWNSNDAGSGYAGTDVACTRTSCRDNSGQSILWFSKKTECARCHGIHF